MAGRLQHKVALITGARVFGIKHAARAMKPAGGGSIISNASIAAHRYAQGGYLYSGAKATLFLASDKNSYLNRLDLVVDGGRIAMFNEKSS